MKSRSHSRGVTLLELLIAVSLVSLLSVGMLWALRVALGAMDRTNARAIANRRVLGASRVLEQQMSGLMPVLTDCRRPGAPPTGAPKALLFQGEPSTLRFVSSYSLNGASRGYPQLLEYAVIPGRQGAGVRLIVNELPYAGPDVVALACAGVRPGPGGMMPVFGPVEPRPDSFVLADRLRSCTFSYLAIDPRSGVRYWLPAWDRGFLPAAIRIEMVPLEPDPTQLQMTTMTFPVRPDRLAEPYVDIDPIQ
jgi:prepilin-type N-terminal cleavage/methylation domain-containing protein